MVRVMSLTPLLLKPPNSAPTASFTYSPQQPEAGREIVFNAAGSSDTDGSITSYKWDFGDGSVKTGQITVHTYAEMGEYEATLTVNDEDGALASETQVVSVVVFADPLFVKGRKLLPKDLDNDGLYEDGDGDGQMTGKDTAALAHIIGANRKGDVDLTPEQTAALDFNGDGRLTEADMRAYNQV